MGPWTFDIDTALVYDANEHLVADVDGGKEWRAAGRLIAAAPELLEACKAVLAERMIYTGAICETLEDSGQWPDLFEKVRDAVAKAEAK